MSSAGKSAQGSLEQASADSASSELEAFRELMFGKEREAINKLVDWQSDEAAFGESVSDVISEAIEKRSSRDNSFTETLQPNFEAALMDSVQNNRELLAETLYPVIGPAIRRSISEAMKRTVDNLNIVIEKSFSPRALKWRIQAFSSGRSFAEVALLNSQDYEIEQVFLIHKETSLLLNHVVAGDAEVRDAELVSAMLSAVQDFVTDSFTIESGDTLNTLEFGEYHLCIVAGPKAVVAAVVRGNEPGWLRSTVHEVCETVHARYRKALTSFKGDTSAFAQSDVLLKRCLVSSRHEPGQGDTAGPAGNRMLLPALACALACVIGLLWFGSWQKQARVDDVIAQLDAQPGFHVTGRSQSAGNVVVHGMRDPLARRVGDIVTDQGLARLDMIVDFKPWYSVDPGIVERRLADTFDFEDTLQVDINESTVSLSGIASYQWLEDFSLRAVLLPGIDTVDTSSVSARYSMDSLPSLGAAMPSISDVIDTVENQALFFRADSTSFETGTLARFRLVLDNIRVIGALAGLENRKLSVEVLATTAAMDVNSAPGPAGTALARQRAQVVARLLDARDGLQINYAGREHQVQEASHPDRNHNAGYARLKIRLTPETVDRSKS